MKITKEDLSKGLYIKVKNAREAVAAHSALVSLRARLGLACGAFDDAPDRCGSFGNTNPGDPWTIVLSKTTRSVFALWYGDQHGGIELKMDDKGNLIDAEVELEALSPSDIENGFYVRAMGLDPSKVGALVQAVDAVSRSKLDQIGSISQDGCVDFVGVSGRRCLLATDDYRNFGSSAIEVSIDRLKATIAANDFKKDKPALYKGDLDYATVIRGIFVSDESEGFDALECYALLSLVRNYFGIGTCEDDHEAQEVEGMHGGSAKYIGIDGEEEFYSAICAYDKPLYGASSVGVSMQWLRKQVARLILECNDLTDGND